MLALFHELLLGDKRWFLDPLGSGIGQLLEVDALANLGQPDRATLLSLESSLLLPGGVINRLLNELLRLVVVLEADLFRFGHRLILRVLLRLDVSLLSIEPGRLQLGHCGSLGNILRRQVRVSARDGRVVISIDHDASLLHEARGPMVARGLTVPDELFFIALKSVTLSCTYVLQCLEHVLALFFGQRVLASLVEVSGDHVVASTDETVAINIVADVGEAFLLASLNELRSRHLLL